jgi:hypothetical protein
VTINEHTHLPSQDVDTEPPTNVSLQPTKLKHACHYFAGYVLGSEVTLKLESVLSGVSSFPTEEALFSFPKVIRENIMKDLMKDLRNKGLNPAVAVEFVGPYESWSILIVTQGGYDLNDPSPEVIEEEKEEILREWLQAKGDLPAFLSTPCPLTLSVGVTQEEYRWGVRFD